MTDAERIPSAKWRVVVFGRTLRADLWWRVRPDDVDHAWLDAVVREVCAGGEGLASGPRYVVARDRDTILVGGACRASLLSDTMAADEHGRPLYAFVGWMTRSAPTGVPSLADMRRFWVGWATAAYEGWMTLDWALHRSRAADPHSSPARRAPWSSIADGPVVPAWGGGASTRSGAAVDDSASAWAEAAATPGAVAFVTDASGNGYFTGPWLGTPPPRPPAPAQQSERRGTPPSRDSPRRPAKEGSRRPGFHVPKLWFQKGAETSKETEPLPPAPATVEGLGKVHLDYWLAEGKRKPTDSSRHAEKPESQDPTP